MGQFPLIPTGSNSDYQLNKFEQLVESGEDQNLITAKITVWDNTSTVENNDIRVTIGSNKVVLESLGKDAFVYIKNSFSDDGTRFLISETGAEDSVKIEKIYSLNRTQTSFLFEGIVKLEKGTSCTLTASGMTYAGYELSVKIER